MITLKVIGSYLQADSVAKAGFPLQWGEEGVDIKDKHYRLVRLHFVDKCAPQTDSPSASLEGMGDTANALLNGTM